MSYNESEVSNSIREKYEEKWKLRERFILYYIQIPLCIVQLIVLFTVIILFALKGICK